jgi:hypothetical protein
VRRDKTIIVDKLIEGRIEEKRDIAKRLLRGGVSIDKVVEYTQLTHEEVEAIKADLDKPL